MSERSQYTLRIEGMTCDGCARHVREALAAVPGVESADVGDWREGTATVAGGAAVTDEALVKAVEKAGYRAIIISKRPLEENAHAPRAKDADFDLLVVGGGSTAFAAAIKASELGARVALVEQGTIGGTCVNIGCVPSKTLIAAAEICYNAAYTKFKGFETCPSPSEWQVVIRQKNELVSYLREAKYVKVLDAHPGVTLVRGRAELTGPREVSVDGKTYTSGKILVATGAQPWTPPIPGLAEAGYLDSTAALDLPELPRSMIVVGGGAIGLELGQLFARFGVRVTLVEGRPLIAAAEEPELSQALASVLAEERMRVLTGATVEQVNRQDGLYHVIVRAGGATEVIEAEQLLVAAGRRPNTGGFGLEHAGVTLGPAGEILVDRHLRTESPDVYAAGDCIGDPMYVYVAAYGGQLAAENALTDAGKVYDLSALPRVTFTDPQLASVGLTEAEARAKGLNVEATILPLEHVPRAQASRDTRGLIKLVRDRETRRLVGAHVLAAGAGDVIQEATLAIRFRLTTDDLLSTYHPYLTMVEGLKLAALTFSKDVAELSCCAT